MSETNEIQSAVDAGRAIANAMMSKLPQEGVPFVVLPNGTIKALERLLPAPTRIRATVQARTTQGFIDYVAVHRLLETTIFSWAGDYSFLAVIDYHDGPQPSWCQHRVELTLQQTPDWKFWMAKNRAAMTQLDFAAFIEDGMPNIAAPPGAELFELVKSLWATKSVNFGSSVRLDNGQHQLTYEETVAGSAGQKGKMEIPSEFTLGLAPFEGSALYELKARFRYRIVEGHLAMWYDLLRPEQVLLAAYAAERDKVVAVLPPVFDARFGKPDGSDD